MKNPLEMWNGLSRNGKIAVVVGALALAYFMKRSSDKKKAAADAAATDSTSPTDTAGTDPSNTNDPSSLPQNTSGLSPWDSSQAYGGSGMSGMPGYVGSYGTDGNPSVSSTTTGAGESGALNGGANGTDLVGLGAGIEAGGIESGYGYGQKAGSAQTGGGAPAQPHPTHAHMAPRDVHRKPPAHTSTTHRTQVAKPVKGHKPPKHVKKH